MNSMINKEEFKDHITSNYSISRHDLERLLEEVDHFYGCDLPTFVQTRHMELKEAGYQNREIYRILQQEAKARRFRIPDLSERQIRRLIYG